MENLFDIDSQIFIQLLTAAGLGALVGLERELAGKDPSLRTFMLISLGSCLFCVSSLHTAFGVPNADPGRIGAQVVTGIGFIGAGAIFRSPRGISGLTTAALMWLTAAIGMSVGIGRIDLAIQTTIIALSIMFLLKFVHKVIRMFRPDLYENYKSDI